MDNNIEDDNSSSALFGVVVIVIILVLAAVWMFFLRDGGSTESDFSELVDNPLEGLPDTNVFEKVEINPFDNYANPFE